jgi:hypothetical protein
LNVIYIRNKEKTEPGILKDLGSTMNIFQFLLKVNDQTILIKRALKYRLNMVEKLLQVGQIEIKMGQHKNLKNLKLIY